MRSSANPSVRTTTRENESNGGGFVSLAVYRHFCRAPHVATGVSAGSLLVPLCIEDPD